MSKKKRRKTNKKRPVKRSILPKRKAGVWTRLLTMAAIVLIVVCCITLFFQVSEIQVKGNRIYSAEQIAEASGISKGDNLVTVEKANAASRIRSTLPFVERVHIERTLPETVIITVFESDVTFAIRAENEAYYLINTQGKVLDEIKTAEAVDYPGLEGLVITEPTIGASIYVSEEQQKNKDAAITIMEELNNYGLAGAIAQINVTKMHDIRVYYGTQYEILLGDDSELSYKVEYLAAVLNELGDGKSGVIDLTFEEEKQARFRPY